MSCGRSIHALISGFAQKSPAVSLPFELFPKKLLHFGLTGSSSLGVTVVSKDCGSSRVPSAGSLSPLLFAFRRSDIRDAPMARGRGRSRFACTDPLLTRRDRRPFRGKRVSTSLVSWDNRVPAAERESFAQKMLELWYTDCCS